MVHELLKMAVDENVSDAIKLAAIRDTAVSVEVGSRPFEQIFDDIAAGRERSHEHGEVYLSTS